MRIPIADAAHRLTELVSRAERGEDVVLTQDGRTALQLVPISRKSLSPEERKTVFDRIRDRKPTWSPDFETDAARSQDFLYDESGLPK